MTYRTSIACDGTSALSPEPRLVLIEGGRSAAPVPVKRRVPQAQGGSTPARGRLAVLSCALSILVTLVLAGAWLASDLMAESRRSAALEGAQTQTVVVQEGDNLWKIASDHAVDGLTTQELVRWISSANDLGSEPIHAGQSILVPAPR